MNWPYLLFLCSRIPQSTKRLLILAYGSWLWNYFALATPYGAELIIAINLTINGSQLIKLLPFLLNIQVRTLDG